MSLHQQSFDYIVLGAGSAGCVLAARLSEDGRNTVLLVEAGGQDRYPWIHIPLGLSRLVNNGAVNWMYESEPEAGLDDRRLFQPRGKVLGGTSSLNGMNYIRGSARDYDDWRQAGCDGWSWDDVLPYFKKSEDQQRGANAFHGVGGPLRVSDPARIFPIAEAFVAAGVEAGLPYNADFNGSDLDGIGPYQANIRDGRRASTAAAFLRPALGRPNLQLVTDRLVEKIEITNGRAVAVQIRTAGGTELVRARREVILAAGAFGTPQILQLSGVGPAQLLGSLGIPVVRDLPAVGADLQDHLYTRVNFRCEGAFTLNGFAHSKPRQVLAGLQYVLTRTGTLATNGLHTGAFFRSDSRLDRPDFQINFLPYSISQPSTEGIVIDRFPGFSMGLVHLNTESRGSVTIRSRDPSTPPRIHFDFLRSPGDVDAMRRGIRLIRTIAQQPALRRFNPQEVVPGPAVASDAELERDLRTRAQSNFHAAGSCAMGREGAAAVDPAGRVYGVDGLRVADASIMPKIVAGNTNAPVIMIAEKIADAIRSSAR